LISDDLKWNTHRPIDAICKKAVNRNLDCFDAAYEGWTTYKQWRIQNFERGVPPKFGDLLSQKFFFAKGLSIY